MDSNLKTLMSAPGLLAFWDFDWKDGISLRTSGANNYVTALLDRTGQFTISQSTEANQPIYGALLGGRHGAKFDGSNDTLDCIGEDAFNVFSGMGSYSLMIIGAQALPGETRAFLSFTNNSETSVYFYHGRTDVGRYVSVRRDAGGTYNKTGANAYDAAPHLTTFVYDGSGETSQSYFYLGGAGMTLNTSGTNQDDRSPSGINTICVGALRISTGAVVHQPCTMWGIILATEVWTVEQRQALEQAAALYWGVK